MSDQEATVSARKRFSPLWIFPIVAALVGVWMVIQTLRTEGPTITIDFSTAAGLEANKTKVRLLSVEIGLVEEIALHEDVSGVTATVKLERYVTPLLREDTRFWVVRAQVGAAGVSGLSTILSGAYIELAPGTGEEGRRAFVGLDAPPLTAVGAPGLRLTLVSDRAASVSAGDPILYRGLHVGRIESMDFDVLRQDVRYGVFIDAPYDELVHTGTRFWDTSGVSINASASGVELSVGSLDTLLIGGVAFGTPPEFPQGEPAADGTEFRLYDSYGSILENPYSYGAYFVVAFDQSVAGLLPGAPVEFRGIKIGRVERILLRELSASGVTGKGRPVPVLIYIEPGRIELPDNPESVELLDRTVGTAVQSGMRATLQVGSLLTGRKLVNFDYYPNAGPAELGQFEEYTTLPTIETGVGRLEQQVSALLTKLNDLPLEDTVDSVNQAVDRAGNALESIDSILKQDSTQALPAELQAAIAEIRDLLAGFSQDAELYQSLDQSAEALGEMLENLNRLTRELADKPNAVVFPVKQEPDPIPEANR